MRRIVYALSLATGLLIAHPPAEAQPPHIVVGHDLAAEGTAHIRTSPHRLVGISMR